MRNPVGLSYLWGCFMYQYPKQILTIDQQVQSYIDVGMEITSREDIEKALKCELPVNLRLKSIYPHKYWIFYGNIGEPVVVNTH